MPLVNYSEEELQWEAMQKHFLSELEDYSNGGLWGNKPLGEGIRLAWRKAAIAAWLWLVLVGLNLSLR
jgi:hypothetical protein